MIALRPLGLPILLVALAGCPEIDDPEVVRGESWFEVDLSSLDEFGAIGSAVHFELVYDDSEYNGDLVHIHHFFLTTVDDACAGLRDVVEETAPAWKDIDVNQPWEPDLWCDFMEDRLGSMADAYAPLLAPGSRWLQLDFVGGSGDTDDGERVIGSVDPGTAAMGWTEEGLLAWTHGRWFQANPYDLLGSELVCGDGMNWTELWEVASHQIEVEGTVDVARSAEDDAWLMTLDGSRVERREWDQAAYEYRTVAVGSAQGAGRFEHCLHQTEDWARVDVW